MNRHVLLIVLCFAVCSLRAQTTSVFHIETVYTPTGYAYYFDKLNPQTGNSVQITQLPIIGYYTGYAFFNCFGNYVFAGVAATTPGGDYINKLYEYDTLGNLIRTIAMDTAIGTWYKVCLPSATTPTYYALRWNTTAQHYQVENIDAVTGARTSQAFPQLSLYNYINSDAAITYSDIIWFAMGDQMTGSDVLFRINPQNGVLTFADTLPPGYYYDCITYDCPSDTIYGFIAHQDSVQGAELLKIDGSTNNIIHTGITANGPGIFLAGVHTRMANGSFYIKGSQQNFLLPNFAVTSPTFTMPVAPPNSTPSTFCFAAPRGTCSHYAPCVDETSTPEYATLTGVAVFPNPANNGQLNIQHSGAFTYEIIDASGRIVRSGNATHQVTLDVSNIADGMYMVRVIQEEASTSQKIVIGH